MKQVLESFDDGRDAEKGWLIRYDTFSDPDEIADRMTKLKGTAWWTTPHEKLGGETPIDVWTEGQNGRLKVWLTERAFQDL